MTHGDCPKHGRYEYHEVEGVLVTQCSKCILDDLRERAQSWYENLPPAKKAILVRQRKVRKLAEAKNLWSYFTGLGAGLTLASTFGLYVLALPTQEPRYFSFAALAGILLSFGFSAMRSRVTSELVILEVERDQEEVALTLKGKPS